MWTNDYAAWQPGGLVGRIHELRCDRFFTLEAYTPIGRAASGGILLTDERVSNEHACLKWRSNGWAIRDLGSTNGTWLNGHLLTPGIDLQLAVGDELAFGGRGDLWRLEDSSPPQPMLCPVAGGEPCVIADGVIAIPCIESAVASIVCGADGGWILESADSVRVITAGAVVDVAGKAWRFSSPQEWQVTAKTTRALLVQESTLHFEVSSDEEHVVVAVEHDGERIAMGQLSAFYFLVTLARLRAEERGRLPPSESGWVHREQLMSMLRCGEQQLNVWVHRVRSRFSSKGFLDYASIIERRDGSGQLRIGIERSVVRATGARA